jgi:hypothetical protein
MRGARAFGGGRGYRTRYSHAGWGSPWRTWWGSSYGVESADPQLVLWIQSCLSRLIGSWVPQTGTLGPATRRALRLFQSRQQLPATGSLDADTIAILRKACGVEAGAAGWDGNADSAATSMDPSAGTSSEISNFGSRVLKNLATQNSGSVEIQQAIRQGIRDENRLTDMLFNWRHPERHGQKLRANEQSLVREWLDIRDRLVRPALQAAASPAASGASLAPAAPAAAKAQSTTSGVEADGDMTHHIPCIQQLQDQGRRISFVQRYLRDLHPPEVAVLKKAGFRIVSCFEENPSDPPITFFTRARGLRDGWRGFAQAQAAGQPAGTPIYFAFDLDPGQAQRQLTLDYFQGVRDGCRQYLADMKSKNKVGVVYAIGVYGSGCVLEWCQAQGLATFFWQAFAPGWCNNRQVWRDANIHTSGRDTPARCGLNLGHLEGWGNEGGW